MLYQKSVLKKYLNEQNDDTVKAAYEIFKSYFHNPKIQQNIIDSKEEQFQEGFLRELFVAVFGYILNPQPEFNLTTELKNEKGSKKADGAVLKDGKAVAVIELKSTKTKDLESIRQQAFDYKANHSDCVYIITSNFHKLRFYINNAVEFEEFDLFSLTFDQFKLLFLCLNSENLLSDLPLKVKEASILEEETITKKFYDDYSNFKKDLFENIAKLNENLENVTKLNLYKKTQKLLDRFLFIFFAEDRNLLPPNSISRMIERWAKLEELDAYKPLYEIYKQYFGYINTGRDGKIPADDIHEYNGGLFLPDELLDRIKIDDDVLLKHTSILTNYDFESQVDVNILGHIFEHSLNEIESTTAELQGVDFDKQKSKRKKDGVFYTPKYITKYIVDNTIGKLCEEKKIELNIIDEEFIPNRKKDTKRKLLATIETYRSWLLELTICDPACGSGAFLNQALEFLINEHHYIDQLNAQLFGSAMVFQDVENQILEKNIFGVDINEESVDIARLSLWLRTAQRGRKLTTLNKNIKCGNSLIDDHEVAGDKAFKWVKEFPEVFANGGFDVVIGNPPYVDIKGLDNDMVKSLFNIYKTTENRINLYSIFIERGYDILKKNGYLSFINPNSILVNSSYTKIRKLLLDDMTTIVKLPDNVFEDAIVETIVFEFRKGSKTKSVNTIVYSKDERINYIDISRYQSVHKSDWKRDEAWNFNIYISSDQIKIISKICTDTTVLSVVADFTLGITPYDKYKGHSQELIKLRKYHSTSKLGNEYKPLISGTNIVRYAVSNKIEEYIKYGNWLGAPREERFFNEPRILIRQIVSGRPPRIYAGYTDQSLYYTQIGFGIIPRPNTIEVKALLALINSKLLNFFHKYSFLDLEKELFQKILIANCKKFPIKNSLIGNTSSLPSMSDKMTNLNKDFLTLVENFVQFFSGKFELEIVSKNLSNWTQLDFSEFLKELKKAKVKLSLSEEAEWMQYFNEQKQNAQAIKAEIDRADKEIDQMVYELYGLTEEEIKIVEES